MYEVKESDWKIFRKRVPQWQEDYMKKLNKEYIEILSRDGSAAKNFWDLENRVFKVASSKAQPILYKDSASRKMKIKI